MDSENDRHDPIGGPVTCPCQLCNPSWVPSGGQPAVTVACSDDDTARVPRTDTVLILKWIVGTSKAAA